MEQEYDPEIKAPEKKRGYGKRSIAGKITFVMILIIITTVVFCVLVNSFFLESYYTGHKQERLENAYSFVREAVDGGYFFTDEFALEFEKLCADDGLSISVLRSDGSVSLTSEVNDMSVRRQIMDVLFAVGDEYHNIIKETENYTVYMSRDDRVGLEYLLLWGVMDTGDLIAVRTAVESIRESAQLSNRFLIIVGLVAVIAAALASLIVGRSLAKPLLSLDDISRRMSELDFDAKYVEGKHDSKEIAELGDHMNKLSQSLESTISQLKTANNELMLDNERKTKIDEMRKEFLSNASHELKTPLALISGYAEGLKDCVNDDAESRDYYVDVIIDETDKMNKMVQKLLTLNSLEFGREQVELVRFDMTELCGSVCARFTLPADNSGIELRFEEPEGVFVWSDAFQIEEVLTNYLSNAVNHCTPGGFIRVWYDKRDDKLRVNVENTGEHLPVEALDSVWVKFYKVDKARTREYGGSGIGLSIVKAIMDSLNNAYGVYNTADGVCFYFEVDLG